MDLDWSALRVGSIGNPKDLWPTEVGDFTPWLIDNLGMLGDRLGLRLEFVDREVSVGDLRADIVAVDEAGRKVIIEAQLGRSDHKHLGQLVTYACAGDANVLVWIAADSGFSGPPIRQEHRTTLARLNERFAGQVVFYALEATLQSEMRPMDAPAGPVLPRLALVDLAQNPCLPGRGVGSGPGRTRTR